MVRRMAVAGALLAAGVALGKPPGLPADPLVEGREPSPVAREHYERAAVGRDVEPTAPAAEVGGWFAWLQTMADFGPLTVRLGTAEVGQD